MVETMEIVKIFEKIQREAATASHETRVVKVLNKEQSIRQGDIYIVRIADMSGVCIKALKPWIGQQLVRGNEGGARHMAESATLYESDSQRFKSSGNGVLLGPIIVAKARWKVTHPEHAHFDMPPGTFQTVYQLDARTQARVRD